jgi:MtrB/PioB family decaheme-associated outer membrane protein
MRALTPVHLVCWIALAFPTAAIAQAVTPQAGSTTHASQTSPAGKPQAPAPAAPQAPAEDSRSLFEPTWRQFMVGGRFTSVDGDPARFQRYQDIRDGVHFTDAKYAREDPEGRWLFQSTADNVGWRDQRYFANFERIGLFTVSGLWDEIPQFYSVDTATPYTNSSGALILDDATQRAIQNGLTPPLPAYIPLAPQFELHERRDIGDVRFKATPTPQLDVTAAYTTQRHVGELPWGASFGFSNDVEVALPYNSRANDLNLGTEWTNGRQMLRVAYAGSWFENHDDTLVWDSPLRLDDHPDNGPGRGRMSLWPSNSAQTISFGGFTKLARRTQLTGSLSFGSWNNDEPLQPFTINATLPQFALPRETAEAKASIFTTNLNLVSRPVTDWRFGARFRRYGYDNEMPQTVITNFVSYDDGPSTSHTDGPENYAHSRTTFDADATWSGLGAVALTAGYAFNGSGHDFRIFESTGENIFYLAADAVGAQMLTFRARYEFADRSGSGLNEDLLLEIGEQPALRHYDIANRTRNRFTGQVDVVPSDLWTFSFSAGFGEDNFDESYFGLQDSTFQQFTLAADYRQPNGLGAGASYSYEHYAGLQRSRSASSGQTPPQETDPNRDWTADSKERVNYFSIYVAPPRIGRNTEARLSYDYSYAEGTYFYAVVPGGPLPAPNQLPNVFNKLQQLRVDVRHRLTNRLGARFAYLYEPFRVYDFAFDQSVVNSIAQPSSLVLGYIYRPYSAHSTVISLLYSF